MKIFSSHLQLFTIGNNTTRFETLFWIFNVKLWNSKNTRL